MLMVTIACEGWGRLEGKRRMSWTSKNWLNEASQNSDPTASAPIQIFYLLHSLELQLMFFPVASASTMPAQDLQTSLRPTIT